jgi:hypothetical protein
MVFSCLTPRNFNAFKDWDGDQPQDATGKGADGERWVNSQPAKKVGNCIADTSAYNSADADCLEWQESFNLKAREGPKDKDRIIDEPE